MKDYSVVCVHLVPDVATVAVEIGTASGDW